MFGGGVWQFDKLNCAADKKFYCPSWLERVNELSTYGNSEAKKLMYRMPKLRWAFISGWLAGQEVKRGQHRKVRWQVVVCFYTLLA